MQQIWNRMPDENGRAYAAFKAYLEQQGKRKTAALSQTIKIPERTLFDWQDRYAWKERAAAYDASHADEREKHTPPVSMGNPADEVQQWADILISALRSDYEFHNRLRQAMMKEIQDEAEYFFSEATGFEEKERTYVKIDRLMNKLNLTTHRFGKRLIQTKRQMERMTAQRERETERLQKTAKGPKKRITPHEQNVLRYWTESWPGADEAMRKTILRMRDNLRNNPALDINFEVEQLGLDESRMKVLEEILAS